jgi:membrane protease YdiL (CAAX protease family)
MEESPGNADLGLLPRDRSFAQSLPAFLFPYVAYVGLGSLPHGAAGPEAAEGFRFAVVALMLWAFRKHYRLGPSLTLRRSGAALAAAIAALPLWVLSYRLSLALPWWHAQLTAAGSARPSEAYWVLRTMNSVLLVPLFEELFCRAYLGELLFGMAPGPGGFSARLGQRMDDHPGALAAPPISRRSTLGCMLMFTIGHNAAAWLPAALYFGSTTWVYRKTGSFRVCVATHGLVNLGLAGLVHARPELRFLWF